VDLIHTNMTSTASFLAIFALALFNAHAYVRTTSGLLASNSSAKPHQHRGHFHKKHRNERKKTQSEELMSGDTYLSTFVSDDVSDEMMQLAATILTKIKAGGTVMVTSNGVVYDSTITDHTGTTFEIENPAVAKGVAGVVSLGHYKDETTKEVAIKEQYFTGGKDKDETHKKEIAAFMREVAIQYVINSGTKKATLELYESYVGPRGDKMGYDAKPRAWGPAGYFIILQKAAGGDLEDRWGTAYKENSTEDKTKCPTRREMIRVYVALMEKYIIMHEHGIQHRDIKPDNILFIGDKPFPADFGRSKPINEDGEGVKDDVGSFGKMILQHLEHCYANTWGKRRDPTLAVKSEGYEFLIPKYSATKAGQYAATFKEDGVEATELLLVLGAKMFFEGDQESQAADIFKTDYLPKMKQTGIKAALEDM